MLRSPGCPGTRLEAPVRERAPQPPGKLAQRLRAGGPRAQLDLALQLGEGPRAVEAAGRSALGAAVAAGRGAGASSPSEPSAITATTAPTTSAAATPAMSMSLRPTGS